MSSEFREEYWVLRNIYEDGNVVVGQKVKHTLGTYSNVSADKFYLEWSERGLPAGSFHTHPPSSFSEPSQTDHRADRSIIRYCPRSYYTVIKCDGVVRAFLVDKTNRAWYREHWVEIDEDLVYIFKHIIWDELCP